MSYWVAFEATNCSNEPRTIIMEKVSLIFFVNYIFEWVFILVQGFAFLKT